MNIVFNNGGDTHGFYLRLVSTFLGTLASAWRTDLPDIAPDGALLVRQGDDVVAYRPDSLAATGRVKGGAPPVECG